MKVWRQDISCQKSLCIQTGYQWLTRSPGRVWGVWGVLMINIQWHSRWVSWVCAGLTVDQLCCSPGLRRNPTWLHCSQDMAHWGTLGHTGTHWDWGAHAERLTRKYKYWAADSTSSSSSSPPTFNILQLQTQLPSWGDIRVICLQFRSLKL